MKNHPWYALRHDIKRFTRRENTHYMQGSRDSRLLASLTTSKEHYLIRGETERTMKENTKQRHHLLHEGSERIIFKHLKDTILSLPNFNLCSSTRSSSIFYYFRISVFIFLLFFGAFISTRVLHSSLTVRSLVFVSHFVINVEILYIETKSMQGIS